MVWCARDSSAQRGFVARVCVSLSYMECVRELPASYIRAHSYVCLYVCMCVRLNVCECVGTLLACMPCECAHPAARAQRLPPVCIRASVTFGQSH